ncbi:MAG: hypothetical protein LKE45_07310 [Olsenella sp.]|nr:hypothetical protein [Olsenella sp.]
MSHCVTRTVVPCSLARSVRTQSCGMAFARGFRHACGALVSVGNCEHGRARARDEKRAGAVLVGNVVKHLVVGDERRAVRLVDPVVAARADGIGITLGHGAHHGEAAAHLPGDGACWNHGGKRPAGVSGEDAVGWSHADESQVVGNHPARRHGRGVLHVGAHKPAHDGGGNVVGVPLDGGCERERALAVERKPGERLGGRDARNHAGRARPKATG